MKMVMTRTHRTNSRRSRKVGSNDKGRTFDQDGSIMNLIDIEPLCSSPLVALMPYRTSEEDILIVQATR